MVNQEKRVERALLLATLIAPTINVVLQRLFNLVIEHFM